MKADTSDRMAAYEAPRPPATGRPMREISLVYHGHKGRYRKTALIPAAMPLPDVITYRGRIMSRNRDGTYVEATVWPIVEGLDG